MDFLEVYQKAKCVRTGLIEMYKKQSGSLIHLGGNCVKKSRHLNYKIVMVCKPEYECVLLRSCNL